MTVVGLKDSGLGSCKIDAAWFCRSGDRDMKITVGLKIFVDEFRIV